MKTDENDRKLGDKMKKLKVNGKNKTHIKPGPMARKPNKEYFIELTQKYQ